MNRSETIHLRTFAKLIFAASIFAFSSASVATSATVDSGLKVIIQNNVAVKMRDGVSLIADIYHPDIAGKFPVLLQRTPYDRKGEAGMAYDLASNGYVVILQDTRGRFASGGEFYPFHDESQDGYDTIEWAAKLEFSNGKVGMFGGSYVGATQMLAAMAQPPHLVAIFPNLTASEYYEGWTYQSGVLMQWFTTSWTSLLAVDTLRRQAFERLKPTEWMQQPLTLYPILSLPAPSGVAPYFQDWLAHERQDSYWQRWRVSDHYQEMNVQALHVGGWNDIFLKGSIKNFTGLSAEGATPTARAGQRLLIGPWAHAPISPEGKIGDVVYGKSAVVDQTATILKWSDYTLKGAQNDYATGMPVRLFIMGDNVWRDEQEFPLRRTRYVKYYLHSKRGANGSESDGYLDTSLPAAEPTDQFNYDPNNPVPTIGGRLCCGTWLTPGPFDQRKNETRPDVLIFSTSPLESDLEATGFVSMELYAATSAVDTDFTALLADVDPAGYARFLTDGIVRARYRETAKGTAPVIPGTIYKYVIDLWATGNVFRAGHRIRLYVSSSNFPRFNRNSNTGEPMLRATSFVTAHQTIYHDREHSSALTLPVIPKK